MNRNINVDVVYKLNTKLFDYIRNRYERFNLPLLSLLYNGWKKDLDKYTTIIVHDFISPNVLKYINRQNPNIRVIVWYWNTVNRSINIKEYLKYNCEIWSFDEDDCKKYGLFYNTQYYSKSIYLNNKKIDTDIFFVGKDKGRLKYILELEKKVNKIGLKTNFHITKSGRSSNSKDINYKYKGKISYEEILDYIAKSKCILDIVSKDQSGLTLRPLEALFFSKKLITNDKSISKRDFYHNDNIFILGVDNLSELPRFLEKEYHKIDESILLKYDIDVWFSRFFKI